MTDRKKRGEKQENPTGKDGETPRRKGRNTPAKENGKSSKRKGRKNQRERTNTPAKENGKNIRGNSAKGSLVAGKSHSVSLRKNSVRRQENIKKTPRNFPGSFFVLDIGKVLLAVGQFDFVKQKFRGFALKRIVFFT